MYLLITFNKKVVFAIKMKNEINCNNMVHIKKPVQTLRFNSSNSPDVDLMKVETCSGTPLPNKRMLIRQYRSVFV